MFISKVTVRGILGVNSKDACNDLITSASKEGLLMIFTDFFATRRY